MGDPMGTVCECMRLDWGFAVLHGSTETNHMRVAYAVIVAALLGISFAIAADAPAHTNRLAKEKSPYLLQHAHNPVDWYPWGPEAFAAAKKQHKPIFLSVGYSTCHW